MSGPAEGKLLLENSKVFVNNKEISADVYIHLKGYSLARVTHLDIESEEINVLKPKEGGFYDIYGLENGIEIRINKNSIKIFHEYLKDVLGSGKRIRTWVGGKEGGIYIGFKKEQIVKLEKIALEKFKIKPK